MKYIFHMLLVMALLLSLSACGGQLDEDQAYALDILSSYREMLVAPDSMVLRSDIALVRDNDADGNAHTYCYFTASGKNTQGKDLISTICYLDGAFFCDMDDLEALLQNGMGTTDTVMDIALLIRCQDVLEKYTQWNVDGTSTVDGATIANRLKIPWEASYD